MKKMIIALALTATTALLAHENYPSVYSVRVVREIPQKVICVQPRIVHVEPARVYYGWNDRRYDHNYYRGYERREHRYERREERHDDHDGWRHERHHDDDRHDRR